MGHKLKNFIIQFLKSPSDASTQAHLFLLRRLPSPNATRIRNILQKTPLILQIETTNICNASCVFCPYKLMKRKKGVMNLDTFSKIISDYSRMGGGPVSLTPIMGDPLLDKHLLERIRLLKSFNKINQISFTTNAIALDRYTDTEVNYLLECLDVIQISIGGLDSDTYNKMYGVDKFLQVLQAVERILSLSESHQKSANIHLAFRTSDPEFQIRFKEQLGAYSRRGALISHIWQYQNYTGAIEGDIKNNLLIRKGENKTRACAMASITMCVCWDGRVSACSCADFETTLQIGNIENTSLLDIWTGDNRKNILQTFSINNSSLMQICENCSAYQPDSIFSYPYFRCIQAHSTLPLDFFNKFWGG